MIVHGMQNNHDDLIPTRWTLLSRLRDWDDQASWRQFFDTYYAYYKVSLLVRQEMKRLQEHAI